MNSVHLSLRNQNAHQLRSGEIGNGSDSLQIGNESNRINDFVLHRESMNFRKVPSLNQMRGLDKSPTHSFDNRGSVDFRMMHGGSQLIEHQDSQGIQSARIQRVDNNTNGNITYSHVSSNNSNNEQNNQPSRPRKSAQAMGNGQGGFADAKHLMTRQEIQLVHGRDPFRPSNFKGNYSQSLLVPNAAESQANVYQPRPPPIQRSIQFGGQGMAQRAIMVGRGVSGIRSKPVLGDHMIIKRSNDIIEESIEDMNDDEHDYGGKYSGQKQGPRLSKVTEGLKDEFDDNEQSNDAFDAAKREDGPQDSENDHLSIEQENLSVSYREEMNRGGPGMPQNRHRVIGRGAASSNNAQNLRSAEHAASQPRATE